MTAPAATTTATPFRLTHGECLVYFAFDVGYGVDLDAARRALPVAAGRAAPARAPHDVPPAFRPEPFRFTDAAAARSLGPWTSSGDVTVSLFDFGAVSLTYRIGLRDAGWDDLQRLAVALDEDRALEADARR